MLAAAIDHPLLDDSAAAASSEMSVDRLRSILTAPGGDHLGDIIFWTLADARIDRVRLERVWTDASLDAALLPEAPTAEKALKLAVRDAQVGQADRLIRLGKEDQQEIVFAVIRECRHEDGSLSYTQEARLQLDRAREVLTTDAPGHDLATAITTSFDTLRGTHTPDDVRRSIVKALRSFAAVTLRDRGGVYWVPAPFAPAARRLQAAIEQIGTSRVYLLPVHRSEDATRALGEIARGAIEEELAALAGEIEQFLAAPPDRESTLVRRLDSFEALRARVRLYRDILHVQVTDLDGQLDRLAASVTGLLDAKQAAATNPSALALPLDGTAEDKEVHAHVG